MATNRPRVIHIVPSLFGGNGIFGGAERYALELARHMADETPTRLISFSSQSRRERIGQLRVQALGRPWLVRGQKTNPIHPGLLTAILQADVVHCHQLHLLASSIAAVASRATGRRIFVTDLGGGGWDISGYVSTDRWYEGHLHISQYSRKIAGHEDKPWAHVILGGVDTDKFSPESRVPRDGTVLYVGRLLPHKGVNDLIDAAPADAPVELIGRPYSDRFLEDLRRKSEGKQIKFRHSCDDEELIHSYRRALCIVLPSVYKTLYGQETLVPELLGQTLLEGMACGTPAICTRVASMPEVVEDGVSGFVVPPNDPVALREKILWLRSNPARAAEMGVAARRRVLDKFTWPVVVRRCLSIYRDS